MKDDLFNVKPKNTPMRESISILLLSLTLGAFLSSLFFSMHQGKSNNINVSVPAISASHSPIVINGNTALDIFCSGKGTDGLTWNTAHLIEDFEIDAGGVDSGIDIRNTNRFLIIRRCTIINSGDKELVDFPDVSIDSGIFLSSVKNVKITECNVNNNYFGIGLFFASNNIISDNIISNNRGEGIATYNASHSIISNNIVSYNSRYGICIGYYSNHNTISDNIALYNEMGILLLGYSWGTIGYCRNNTISSNNASYNDYYGIKLIRSGRNTIMGNYVSFNGQYGIFLDDDCIDNEVFQNILCYNEFNDIKVLGQDNNIHNNKDCSQSEVTIPNYPIVLILEFTLIGITISICIALEQAKFSKYQSKDR